MEIGIGEKAIFTYLVLLVAIMLLIGYLFFVQIGIEDSFLIPAWNLILFATFIFGFYVYIWDRSISIRRLLLRTLRMLFVLAGWSVFMGFLASIIKGDLNIETHIIKAFTSLPLFIISMAFVLMISFLHFKIFSAPIFRTFTLTKDETDRNINIDNLQIPGLNPSFQEEQEAFDSNPFEFHPDPTVTFEELPSFFLRKLKGLVGCVIFNKVEGLTMASSLPPGFNIDLISAYASELINEENNLISIFSKEEKMKTDTIIYSDRRMLAFSTHQKYPSLFIFDESVSANYIKRALSVVGGIVDEYLVKKAPSLSKEF